MISTTILTILISLIASTAYASTVSGLSSGGFMAVQFHVAFSSSCTGAGVVAGGPYYCAQGLLSNALFACMTSPASIVNSILMTAAKNFERDRLIDPLSNLAGSKVWLYSGSKDTTVVPGVMRKLEEFYAGLVPASNIASVFNIASEHAIVTNNYGNACAYKGSPYINNCNYDSVQQMFTHLYGSLNPATTPIAANLVVISQSKYTPNGATPSSLSLSNDGYAYIPTGCKSGGCKVHVAFHGCLQSVSQVGRAFIEHAGYNRWAESNNIVILYPQTVASSLLGNPNACWDWWGYGSKNYANKNGPQMVTVMNIVNSIESGAFFDSI